MQVDIDKQINIFIVTEDNMQVDMDKQINT